MHTPCVAVSHAFPFLPPASSSLSSFMCQCCWCSVIFSQTNLPLPPFLNYTTLSSSLLTSKYHLNFGLIWKPTRACQFGTEFSTRDSSPQTLSSSFLHKGMFTTPQLLKYFRGKKSQYTPRKSYFRFCMHSYCLLRCSCRCVGGWVIIWVHSTTFLIKICIV